MFKNNKGVTHLAILVILFVLAASVATVSSVLTYGKGGAPKGGGAPSTPTGLAVSSTQDTQVSLSWTVSLGSTDYLVQYQVSGGQLWTTFNDGTSTNNFMTVTGLSSGTTYNFKVAARNNSGTSAYSSSVSTITLSVSDAPTNLSATDVQTTEVSLSWTSPGNNGGASITDYAIQYQTTLGSWIIFNDGISTNTTTTVTGLSDDTLYFFKVAAINSVGTSNYTSAVSTTTSVAATVPDAPNTLIIGEKTDTTIVLSWVAPNSNGADITDYIIKISSDGGSTYTTFNDGTSTKTTTTVTGLTSGGTYFMKVSALNSKGSSPVSSLQVHRQPTV